MPLLATPPGILLPDPAENSHWYGELWLKYPSSNTLVPVQYGATFKAITEIRVIINNLATAFFDKSKRASSATVPEIQYFWIRLERWYCNLPAELAAKNISFPWQLKLQ